MNIPDEQPYIRNDFENWLDRELSRQAPRVDRQQNVSPAGYACDAGAAANSLSSPGSVYRMVPYSWKALAHKQADCIAALEAEVGRLTALLTIAAPPPDTKPGIPARALSRQTMRIGLHG